MSGLVLTLKNTPKNVLYTYTGSFSLIGCDSRFTVAEVF
jgi:hypothetical protein